MKVRDLLDPIELTEMIEGGYIRVRHHPKIEGLRIYNYSEKAAYESMWNNSTMTCRGLIADRDNDIIARPFPKFFNYGQTGAAEIGLDEYVRVTDKMDGSLGIIYPTYLGHWAVATRGSFESEQAIHATELLKNYYGGFITAGTTYLVEIIYPANRIVLDYGDMDELVLLGGVHVETGNIVDAEQLTWNGPRTKSFNYASFADALAVEPRQNAEGYVIRTWDNRMLKLKQADYTALHRIVTGLSEKTVWEALANGTYEDLLEKVPDEFHTWLRDKAEYFKDRFEDIEGTAYYWYESSVSNLGYEFERRDFAIYVNNCDIDPSYRPFMFAILDEKPIDDMIWKRIRPVGSQPMKLISEDVA